MLSGIRVLDLTDERAHLAGRILADLGAEVIAVEPPGGDPVRRRGPFVSGREGADRGLRWITGNAGKRSVVLDLETRGGRAALQDLVRGADVLIDGHSPGWREARDLSDERLREIEPGLVIASVTPFGRTGPRSGERASDLAVVASGGNAYMTGEPDGEPTRCSLPTSTFHAAPEAVVGVLLALLERDDSGWGQSVDVSMQECQVTTLLSGPAQLDLSGRAGRRTGARLGRTREIWAAQDGWISFGLRGGPARIPNLIATVELMAESDMAPDWLLAFDWEKWNPLEATDAEIARVEEAFGAFFATRTMRQLYDQALDRRILLAPCNDAREVLDHPQLRFRDLFAPVAVAEGEAEGADGAAEQVELPGRFALWNGADGALGVRGRAPSLAEHQAELLAGSHDRARSRPPREAEPAPHAPGTLLSGLRILELGSGAAGPVATRYFAEQGAAVVRLESFLRPDFLRFLQPHGREGLDRSPMFALLNADKQSLALDMKKPEGLDVFHELVDWADVVSENFAPGVLERWGIDVGALCERNPGLIVVRSCLFGQTGPQRRYPGFGGQGSAIAGFNHMTGREDGEAVGPYATITDSLSPRYVGVAVTAALWQKCRTGRGGVIDISQIETGVYSLAEMVARESAGVGGPQRIGNRSEHAVPHGVYPCRGEDRWVVIAVRSDRDWRSLVAEMAVDGVELPDAKDANASLAERRAAAVPLDACIAEWTRSLDAVEVARRLQAAGVEAAAVADFADLLKDPQLAHREHFVRVPHAELGEVLCERPGYRLSRAPGRIRAAGPNLGADSRSVLRERLGLDDDAIDGLERAEALR